MLRRLWEIIWVPQVRRELTFLISSIATVVVVPGAGLKVATGAALLIALLAYLALTRLSGRIRGPALLVCAAASIVSIFLSHNGLGEVAVLLCTVYARVVFTGEKGRVITALLGLAFGIAVAWVSNNPVGVLAGLGVPVLAARRLEQDQLQAERDRAVRLLAELERARDAQALAAALEERGRIAREMHDVLAHSLAGLSLQLQAVRAVATRENVGPAVTEPLDRAAELARSGLAEAKAVVGALRDAPDGSAGLGVADLPTLVARFPGEATLVENGRPAAVGPAVGHAIYRAVQESLTNATRYAPGSAVRVELTWATSEVRASITDDGPGEQIVAASQGSGQGLRGMRERLAAVGGQVHAGPHGSGWRSEIVVPLIPSKEPA